MHSGQIHQLLIGNNFKLRSLELDELSNVFPTAEALARHITFLRSDHVRFWFAHHEDYFASFPCLHLSDTGPARGIMRRCYHGPCDDAHFNRTQTNFASMDLLAKVTQTAIDMLMDFRGTSCGGGGRPMTSEPTNFNFYDKRTNEIIKGIDPY